MCNNVFGNESLSVHYNYCPLRGCSGELIELDENLYEAFVLLNKKGYVTGFCCSAHSFSSNPRSYILIIGEHSFPSLPEGFKCKRSFIEEHPKYGDTHSTTLSKEFSRSLSNLELQKQIWKTALDVLEWVESLELSQVDICNE